MAIEQRDKIHAVASVDNGGGGAGTSQFTFQRGFAGVVHTAAGVYTLTYDAQCGPIDLLESAIIVTPLLATAAYLTVTVTNDTTIVVRSWSNVPAALDDVPFYIMVVARGA